MTSHTYQLKDGRNLSYSLYGPGDGQPVLYFHGTPSSRLEPLLLLTYNVNLDAILSDNNVQLIAVDRPGMGLSSYHKQGTFLSFADDCIALLNHLNISSVNTLGWSGAGPYELAIASKYPSIIKGVFIIAGFTKSFHHNDVFSAMYGNKYYFGTAKKAPWLLQKLLSFISKKDPKKPIPRWISALPDVDHQLMENPSQIKAIFQNTLREACRQHAKGPVHEAAIYFNDFEFDLASIKPPVYFWWGSEDKNVTRIHLEHLQEQLPSAVINFKDGEGHLSIYVKYFKEIIATVAKELSNSH